MGLWQPPDSSTSRMESPHELFLVLGPTKSKANSAGYLRSKASRCLSWLGRKKAPSTISPLALTISWLSLQLFNHYCVSTYVLQASLPQTSQWSSQQGSDKDQKVELNKPSILSKSFFTHPCKVSPSWDTLQEMEHLSLVMSTGKGIWGIDAHQIDAEWTFFHENLWKMQSPGPWWSGWTKSKLWESF